MEFGNCWDLLVWWASYSFCLVLSMFKGKNPTYDFVENTWVKLFHLMTEFSYFAPTKLSRLPNILFWGLFLHLWDACCCLHFLPHRCQVSPKFTVKNEKWTSVEGLHLTCSSLGPCWPLDPGLVFRGFTHENTLKLTCIQTFTDRFLLHLISS